MTSMRFYPKARTNSNTFAPGLEWKRSLQTADVIGAQAFFGVLRGS
jgi:hypothetical protein